MKINWAHILEGWRNNLIPPVHLKEAIKQTSKERLAICRECSLHSSNFSTPLRWDEHCTVCGCPLKALTKCLACDCSIEEAPKWKAVITIEEEEHINLADDNEKR